MGMLWGVYIGALRFPPILPLPLPSNYLGIYKEVGGIPYGKSIGWTTRVVSYTRGSVG